MESGLKRQLDLSLIEEDDMLEKRLHTTNNSKQIYGTTKNAVSELLVPDINLQPLQTPQLFARRTFPYIMRDLTIKFRDLTPEQTRWLLTELEEKYKKNDQEEKKKSSESKPLSKKEQQLSMAAELLFQCTYTNGDIAKLTGLSNSTISNLKTRLNKRGSQTLPSFKGGPKRLTSEHVDFIKGFFK